MRASFAAAALVASLAACLDPARPGGEPTCESMCSSFRAAGCAAGEPSPRKRITCEQRCETQLRTRAVEPPLACVTAAAGNAGRIEACGERCR